MRDGSQLRLLVYLAVAAGFWLQTEAAEAAKQPMQWRATDGSVAFVPIGDRVWVEHRNGRLMPYRYHHYRTAGKTLFLYDLKRHLKIKLFPSMVLLRWNLRKQLNFWMLYRWGRWRTNARPKHPKARLIRPASARRSRPAPARRAALRPRPAVRIRKAARPRPTPTSRPTSRPASRPVARAKAKAASRPALRPASRPASRPVKQAQKKPPQRLRKPLKRRKPPKRIATRRMAPRPATAPLPRAVPRALFPMMWQAKGINRFFFHVGGRLWREVRKGRFTGERFLEVARGRQFVKLFDPRRKVWLSLTETTWYLRFKKGGTWNRLMEGKWLKKRPVVRASWQSRNRAWRFHQITARVWQTYYQGRAVGKPLFLLRKNRRYLDMRNKRRLVRIYKGHLFGKLLRRGAKWRLLLRGHWDQNPPDVRTPRRLKKKAPTRSKPAAKRRLVAKRKQPARRATPPVRRAKASIARGSGVLPPKRRKVPPRRATKLTAKRARAPKARAGARTKPPTVLTKRMRVKKTRKRPWSSVAFVRTLRRNKSKGFATGVMIGPRLLLTTGSVVYRRSTKKTIKAVSVYPAINHRSTPFGYTAGVRWYAHPKWIKSKKGSVARHYDLGIVVLRSPLGKRTKWLPILPSKPGAFRRRVLTMAGYPLDKFYKTRNLWQWRQSILGTLDLVKSYPLKWHFPTRHKTSRGSLGSPLMWKQGKRWWLLGLYHGTVGKYAESVRITKEHMKWIRKIRRAEAKRWQRELARAKERLLPKDPVPQSLRFWEGQPVKLEEQGKSSSVTFP